ncbi:MAG: HlyD family efflux transporter periplasmic adaptor subunit [Bacteroidota bacterium]
MVRTKFTFGIGLILMILFSSCGRKTEETQPIEKNITESVFATGSLKAKGAYQLKARTSGYITRLDFESGDIVKTDDIVAIIRNDETSINEESAQKLLFIAEQNARKDAPLLQQAANSIEINKAQMEQDLLTLQRYERLFQSNSVSQKDYENAELSYQKSKRNYQSAIDSYHSIKTDADQKVINQKASLEVNASRASNTQVLSLSDGRIYKLYKEVGDYVQQGETIAEIGNPLEMIAEINIDEKNISQVSEGQRVIIELNSHQGEQFEGKLSKVLPAFDEATQSFSCEVTIYDTLPIKITGTPLESNVIIAETDNALLIPKIYLNHGGYVQVKGEKEKRKVETKFVSNEWVQILSGIDIGTTLITYNVQ